MKVAISSAGVDLSSQVDPRFGRCQYFIIVDPETKEFEAVANPNISASGGAGIQSAQLVAGKDIKAVLTGNCGPNAFTTLQAAGVEVITGVAGKVEDAIEQYKQGQLQATNKPTVEEKSGINQINMSSGQGPGAGMGKGGGRGMGRGMGGGRGQGGRRF